MIGVSENNPISAQKRKQNPNKHHGPKLKAFWEHFLNQINQEKKRSFRNSCTTTILLCLYWRFVKAFEFIKERKNWSVIETEPSYKEKLVHADNLGKNIWNKLKKSTKIGLNQKTFITPSVSFLNTIRNFLFLEGRRSTRVCLNPIFSLVQYIPIT